MIANRNKSKFYFDVIFLFSCFIQLFNVLAVKPNFPLIGNDNTNKVQYSCIQKSKILEVDRLNESLPKSVSVYAIKPIPIIDLNYAKNIAKSFFSVKSNSIEVLGDRIYIEDNIGRFYIDKITGEIEFRLLSNVVNPEIWTNIKISKPMLEYENVAKRLLTELSLFEPDMKLKYCKKDNIYNQVNILFHREMLGGIEYVGPGMIYLEIDANFQLLTLRKLYTYFETIDTFSLIPMELALKKIKEGNGIIYFKPSRDHYIPGNVRNVKIVYGSSIFSKDSTCVVPVYIFEFENLNKSNLSRKPLTAAIIALDEKSYSDATALAKLMLSK